jgi:ubiquinone/menaquinone biosynthesis C-methylase UbiE
MATYGLVGDTVRWYRNNGTHQYEGDGVGLYDRAADLITKRREFAAFLAGCIRKPEGKTLEIAAGTGLVSQVLQGELDDVTFLDYSASALDVLRGRVGTEGRLPSIVQASYYDQPFPDETFDTVVCVGGYRYVAEGQEDVFWSENSRILKAGGSLLCAQFKPRFVSMNGQNLPTEVEGLETINSHEFDARVGGAISFRTGTYEVMEYQSLVPAEALNA